MLHVSGQSSGQTFLMTVVADIVTMFDSARGCFHLASQRLRHSDDTESSMAKVTWQVEGEG
jgi:hypothetical protein